MGVDTIFYTLPAGSCGVFFLVTVEPLPAPILGPDTVCQGSSVILTDATTGGIWSSSNTAVAFIDVTGDLTGITPGTSTITWTLSTGCSTSVVVTVNSLPSPILSFADHVCAGNTVTVLDPTAGGTWSINDTTLATIAPLPGSDTAVVTSRNAGTIVISYTLSTGCAATFDITIDPVPPRPVPLPDSVVCVGQTVTFTDAATGGTWASGDTTIAIIDSITGLTTGEGSGTVTITYTGVGGCPAIFNPFRVHPLEAIGASDSVLCQGNSVTLINHVLDGTWFSTNTSIATVVVLSAGGGTATVTGAGGGPGGGPGIDTIIYTTPNGCQSQFVVTVDPITPIIGPALAELCVNDSFILFDGTTGGVWSSSDTTVAQVSPGGEVHGISAGTATISYTLATGCFETFDVTVNPIPAPIGGIDSVCVGHTITLNDDDGGGVWGSSNTSVASVLTASGSPTTILGVSAGTATISYIFPSLTGCSATVEVTVDPITGIYGDSLVCALDSIQLFDSTAGGVWSSSNTGVATITSTGMVTGVSAGTAIISYVTNIGGCPTSFQITVNPLPAPITGIDSVCVNNITHLFDTSAGGTGAWTSSTTTIATIGSTGIVTGVAAGTVTITYTLPVTGCVITTQVTVDPLPSGITGTASMCAGDSVLLHDASSGGVWTSSNTSVATVNDTGYVKGLTAGTATISYTLHVGACPASLVVTVYPIPVITISSVPDPPVICKGGADALTASGADVGGTYAWTPAYGLSGTGIFDPIATPTITTTYEVIGTTAHGCRDSAFITVFVDSMLNHLKVVGVDSICNGQTDTLEASGEPEALFNWHPTTGIIGANPADTIVVRPTATTTYVAVAIDAMGCKDSVSFKVTVNPIPQIKVAPTPVIVCRGVPLQLLVNTTNTDSNTTKFAWSPNILISCDTCDNPILYDTFNIVYKVIATSIYGCYDSLNVKVSVLDTNVNTISHDTDICIGDSIRLVATSNSLTGNLDVPTFYWTPGTGLSNQQIFDPIATPQVTTTYSVTIKENACFTVVDTVTVRVQPLPSITITVSPPSQGGIVAGTPTTLTATAPNVDAVRFLWVPGNSLNCDTCFDPVATPTVQTTYTVTVTSNYGCVYTDTVTIKLLCDNSEIFIPNTFTPNGDGVNDRFFVSGKGISQITNFSVFNRWGELVFQAHNIPANSPGFGWDGTFKGYVLEPDVFIYVVDALCELGTTSFHYQGDISIVK